jgi:hypothetical protein
MVTIYSQGFILKISPAWYVERLISKGFSWSLLRLAVAIAEICGFILI